MPVTTRRLELSLGSGDAMDVRRFRVSERMSGLFEVVVLAVCADAGVDLDAAVGTPASFTAHAHAGSSRTWAGIASRARLVRAEERGLSTYEVTIVPRLWLLGQNADYRVFQHLSEPSIVDSVLGKWGVSRSAKLSSTYKKRKYRVQYGESDLDFVCRMLEDAGVSFHFEEGDTMVLSDAPEEAAVRGPIPFRAEPSAWESDLVTDLQVERALRPGRVTLRDHDYRKPPQYALLASAGGAPGVEAQLERYTYAPGAFLFESDRGESTPFSDDKGKYRVDEGEAARLAERRLHAARGGAKTVTFRTSAIDVGPGTVVAFSDHPSPELGSDRKWLVTAARIEGAHDGEWTHLCEGTSAEVPCRPERRTARPAVNGVESATVVGPPGEEIHTDEFGRVRVQFHWDRDGKMDDRSSCWIHVSQPWAGAGYGGVNLPRVGQEVVVDFLGGDPDRPVIVGRVYTNLQRAPYRLPETKTQTVFRSQSTRGKQGYNEIRYEDQAGSELFRVQAEKDYHKLVKNDERVVIGNDRDEEVKRDEKHVIHRDREHAVLRDHTEVVGNDRTRTVKNDESVTIGNNLDVTVVNNEKRFVGNNRAVEIAEDESLGVGGHMRTTVKLDAARTVGLTDTEVVGAARTRTVGGPESVKIGAGSTRHVGGSDSLHVAGSRTKAVQGSETTTIGAGRKTEIATADHLSVGQSSTRSIGIAEQVSVGGMSNTSVGLSRSAQIGQVDAVTVGKTFSVAVGGKGDGATGLVMHVDEIELRTPGGAVFRMKGDTITLDAAHVVVNAGEDVKATAASLFQVKSTGGDVVIRGGPMVKINT